jgi:hypothetical protein
MTDPRKQQKADQDFAKIRDGIPAVWWALYTGCKERGFSDQQSFALVTSWVLGTAAGKVVPPTSGPLEDGPTNLD